MWSLSSRGFSDFPPEEIISPGFRRTLGPWYTMDTILAAVTKYGWCYALTFSTGYLSQNENIESSSKSKGLELARIETWIRVCLLL